MLSRSLPVLYQATAPWLIFCLLFGPAFADVPTGPPVERPFVCQALCAPMDNARQSILIEAAVRERQRESLVARVSSRRDFLIRAALVTGTMKWVLSPRRAFATDDKLSENLPKNFLDRVLRESGGVRHWISLPGPAQVINLLGRETPGSVLDPVIQQRLVQCFLLTLFFRDHGGFGATVQNSGKDLETYLASFVDAEMPDNWFKRTLIFGSTDARKNLERRVYSRIQNDLFLHSESRDRFIRRDKSPSMTPLLAYALLGASLHYFGVAQEVRLRMAKSDKAILLEVTLDPKTSVLIDLRAGPTPFDRTGVDTDKISWEALSDCAYFKHWLGHKVLTNVVLNGITPLKTFDGLISIFAPYLFNSDREKYFKEYHEALIIAPLPYRMINTAA